MKDDLTTLEQMTKSKFLTERERENLRSIANKITKVPDSINIPVEYMVKRERERK